MEEAEKFLWEEIAQLPEHKRAFDTDVFKCYYYSDETLCR